jgi:glycosyltransferase involved in cell wall biosynthesis
VKPPLKLLILGRDPDMFARGEGAANDTRERHIAYVRELQRRRPGSEVRIVVHTWQPGAERFDEPFAGLRIYGTASRLRLQAPLEMVRLIRSFRRDGWEADLVSCQTGYEEAPLAFLAAGPRSRIQVQVHNDYFSEAFGGENLLHSLQRRVIRHALRRCDHARVVSLGIRRALIESGDIAAERISVAPVPVAFHGLAPRPDPASPVVLFVGRLVTQKDLGLWCDTARAIHRKLPRARFWIVGQGPDRALVEQRLADLGAAVRMFGAVAYGDLPAVYAQASLFLLTSRYEGLGRVVVEAMLAGVPVVSTDIVGPQDLIEDRRTGRLVPRDAEALAEASIELLTDGPSAARCSAAARDWAERNYGFAAIAARLVDSWEAAAALPPRRA